MIDFIEIAPPNCLLCISDPNGGIVPDFVPGQLVLATSSFITVGCLAFMDGETKVTLGPADEVDPGDSPEFDSYLDTPNQAVAVSTVEDELLLQQSVPTARIRVRIWTNHPSEPDRVIIRLG